MSHPPGLRQVQPQGPRPERRLESWKEIAAYLNRTIRTAQRWERTEGLPVQRHSHEKRDSVFASSSELDTWWENRRARLEQEEPADALEAPAEEGPSVRRRWGIPRSIVVPGGVLAGLMVVAAGATWYVGSSRAAALPFAARDWVLVEDFDNQTGDPLFDKTLSTAFIASFEQSKHANVIPRAQIEDALRRMGKNPSEKIDEQLGREVCVRENARGLIRCSIGKVGTQYVLTARLVDPRTGEAVRSYIENAAGQNQILGALGHLASRIRRDLGESLLSIRRNERPLPQVTTPSLYALELLAQGQELWQKGKYREAVTLFRDALRQDPDFAMAHAALGSACLSHIFSDPVEGKAHYDRALQLTERLSERERLHILVLRANSLGHFDEAVRLGQAYLGMYPDDWRVRYSLGTLLMNHDRLPEAVEQFQQVIRVAPNDASSHINLASSYDMWDKSNEALASYAKAFELEPGWITLANLNHEYGFALVKSGNPAKAREVFALAIAKPESRPNGLRSEALLDMYEGKYGDAKTRLREAILSTDNEVWRLGNARNHFFMSSLLGAQGDKAGELGELDQASHSLELLGAPCNWLSARIAIAYARAGSVEKAERILEKLKRDSDPNNPKESSELRRLEGEVALAGGNRAPALEALQRADLEASGPLTLESLAYAYDKAGTADRAVSYYEKVIGQRLALGWEPQQAWLAAHARLAEFYQQRGEKARAAEVIGSIVELWKQADAQLPLAVEISRLQKALATSNGTR